MSNPITTIHDATTGETIVRELTDEEYAAALADGQTFEPEEETPEE